MLILELFIVFVFAYVVVYIIDDLLEMDKEINED